MEVESNGKLWKGVDLTNYDKGASFERRVMKDMEGRGYACVRSSGSHSPADLACVRDGFAVFVQCKTNGRLDPGEWNAFRDFCEKAGAVPVMARNAKGKIEYWALTGKKDGTGGKQPMRRFEP